MHADIIYQMFFLLPFSIITKDKTPFCTGHVFYIWAYSLIITTHIISIYKMYIKWNWQGLAVSPECLIQMAYYLSLRHPVMFQCPYIQLVWSLCVDTCTRPWPLVAWPPHQWSICTWWMYIHPCWHHTCILIILKYANESHYKAYKYEWSIYADL